MIDRRVQILQPYRIYQLPITKIQYISFSNKKRQNSHLSKGSLSKKVNKEKMPIQIVLDKISLQKKQQSIKQYESPIFCRTPSPDIEKRLNSSSKKKQRQLVKVKPYVFQKFNYQSYVNYQYKTSKKVFKYQEQNTKLDGFKVYERPMKLPPKVKQFDRKNIEIVFCENKYKDFVQKVNEIAQEQYIKKRTKSMSSIPLPKYSKTENGQKGSDEQIRNPQQRSSIDSGVRGWNYSRYNSKTLLTYKNNSNATQNNQFNIRNKEGISSAIKNTSSLMNCLKQFKNLQKITEYMLEQSSFKVFQNQFIQKNNNYAKDDLSKTVSLSILWDKYSFLKKMNKSLRESIFKLIMGQDQLVTGDSKINIHHYLKFNRIFIGKDANNEELGNFIYNLLFQKKLSFQSGNRVLGKVEVGSSSQLRDELEMFLFELFNRKDIIDEQIIEQICTNKYFSRLLIQFITKK